MAELFPLARTDDLLAGFHVPGDGRVNPVDVTMSLARGARNLGVRVVEGVSVEQVLTARAASCRRSSGCARMPVTSSASSSSTARGCGPASSPSATAWWCPTRRRALLPRHRADRRDERRRPGLRGPRLVRLLPRGGRRHDGRPLRAGGRRVEGRRHPEGLLVRGHHPDWDRMGPFVERAISRVPVVETVGIRTFFCGPSPSPRLAPAVGEAPGIHGYFVCAGLNSVGVLSRPVGSAGWSRSGSPTGARTSTSPGSTSHASATGS